MPTFALISWPLVALALFAALGPQRGIIWSVVIGYLFLPENFGLNPPGLPRYGKITAIGMGVFLGMLVFRSKLPQHNGPRNKVVFWMMWGLLFLLLFGPVITTMVNRTPVFFGPTMRRGMTLWDVQSYLIPMLFILAPWIAARRYLNTPEMHVEILRAIIVVGLFYTLLALFELRMSPQLNNMFYGYFPHSWRQHIRGGGFRPLVFLDHGLSLGFFLMSMVLAAVALMRDHAKEKRAFYLVSAIWSFLVLAVSSNLGALALAVLFLPLVCLLSRRLQVRVAMFILVAFMINPIARDYYVQPLLSAAETISQSRHDSLKTRFDNEQAMLDRQKLKPITGWGEWSRWRIHDERGRDITISDGTWIIVLAKWGWIGFIGFFGMIAWSIMFVLKAARNRKLTYATAGLTMITTANLIYLIPNSTLTPISWMIAGALFGYVQFASVKEDAPDPDTDPDPEGPENRRPAPIYTRFPKGAAPVTRRRVTPPARTGARAQVPRASGQ